MLESIIINGQLSLQSILVCSAVSVVLGLVMSLVYMYKTECSRDFVIAVVLLPLAVQAVIMMVNGNIGSGVAVAGAFSLVRFRSAPGSAKEILCIFCAMALGIATGMGYVGFAVLTAVLFCLAIFILTATGYGETKVRAKHLDITIPENLDYTGLFDDLMKKYTYDWTLERVKTTNMGSLFELRYRITLKDSGKEKELIDAVRCRNGNLRVSCARLSTEKETL